MRGGGLHVVRRIVVQLDGEQGAQMRRSVVATARISLCVLARLTQAALRAAFAQVPGRERSERRELNLAGGRRIPKCRLALRDSSGVVYFWGKRLPRENPEREREREKLSDAGAVLLFEMPPERRPCEVAAQHLSVLALARPLPPRELVLRTR